MAESQDVNLLKRRGRRRLVGAVALVLVAVIVLPMVFDPEPRQGAPAISVRIPGENDVRFTPNLAPQPSAGKAATVSPPPAAPHPAPAAPAVAAPSSPATVAPRPAAAAPAATPPPAAPAKSTTPSAKPVAKKGDFVIQVAALGEDEKVKALSARLSLAKLPHYTEPVAIAKGKVTRVRVGPFATRAAAERAVKALTAMGLKPGGILERP